MKNRKWVKHLIKRFGRSNCNNFAISLWWCPCEMMKWYCKNCGFKIYLNLNGGHFIGCKEGREWAKMDIIRKNKIKDKLIKKVKK
jgi:hypothetical protein